MATPVQEDTAAAKIKRQRIIEQFQDSLEKKNAKQTRRLQECLSKSDIKERINEGSYSAWIAPLLFIEMQGDTVVLFHKQYDWVQKYYGYMIEEAIGKKVKIINKAVE